MVTDYMQYNLSLENKFNLNTLTITLVARYGFKTIESDRFFKD